MNHENLLRAWTQAQPMVASYLHSVVRDFHRAEDLLQEVAVVLLKKADDYDSSRPFLPWALGVARFEVLAQRRTAARSNLAFRSTLLEQVADAHAELAPELEQRAAALRGCLEGVQGRSRRALELRYVDGLAPREIGRRTGKKSGAVRVLLSRVRASLRQCVDRRLKTAEHPA
jgi:RNA polymerase sigma-70 factor (ECF subfamily)